MEGHEVTDTCVILCCIITTYNILLLYYYCYYYVVCDTDVNWINSQVLSTAHHLHGYVSGGDEEADCCRSVIQVSGWFDA